MIGLPTGSDWVRKTARDFVTQTGPRPVPSCLIQIGYIIIKYNAVLSKSVNKIRSYTVLKNEYGNSPLLSFSFSVFQHLLFDVAKEQ